MLKNNFTVKKRCVVPPINTEGEYVIINNIPKIYHTSHLRNYFSSFVESGGFICFHYRHRPEVQKPSTVSNNSHGSEASRRVTNCCIVKIVTTRVDEFIKQYNGEHWLDCKGETLLTCCFIKKITFSDISESVSLSGTTLCKQGTVAASLPLDKENITREDISTLIEMNPPSFMPNGNVGTKTSHFMKEIRMCRLPPSLISKLGLQFPRNRSRRIYGSVPLDYKNRTHRLRPIFPSELHSNQSKKGAWCSKKMDEDITPDENNSEESESEEEEWDRHEALHDDVSGQERNKERLFEEKIELKWEKGGSGLVFYTDAQFWDAKEGDFDAKTSDDWDIDTNIYTHPGLDTDKDMKDLIRLRLETKLRNGSTSEEDSRYDFAAFEKYNKGFGRKLMESQGWKQGQGIGKKAGISEPIPNEGQLPDDKKGFGYRGEKLNRCSKRDKRKRRRDDLDDSEHFHISTIYDNPVILDPPESVFVSSSFSKLKYRQKFLKEHECDT